MYINKKINRTIFAIAVAEMFSGAAAAEFNIDNIGALVTDPAQVAEVRAQTDHNAFGFIYDGSANGGASNAVDYLGGASGFSAAVVVVSPAEFAEFDPVDFAQDINLANSHGLQIIVLYDEIISSGQGQSNEWHINRIEAADAVVKANIGGSLSWHNEAYTVVPDWNNEFDMARTVNYLSVDNYFCLIDCVQQGKPDAMAEHSTIFNTVTRYNTLHGAPINGAARKIALIPPAMSSPNLCTLWDCAKIMTEYKLAIDTLGLDVGAVAFFTWGSIDLELVSGAREFPQLVNLTNGWRTK
jgi:hypothetical protein